MTKNPFAAVPRPNPFGIPDPKLVSVPTALETHEQRKPLRSYLAASGGGGLGELLGGLGGKPSKPRVIEVVRTVPAVPEAAEG